MECVLITGTSSSDVQFIAAALGRSAAGLVTRTADLADAEATCSRLLPDAALVVCDGGMPPPADFIGRLSMRTRVLLFGVLHDELAVDALLAGARGVIHRDAAAAEIVDTLQMSEADGVICSDRVRYALFGRLCRLTANRTSNHCLACTDLSFQEVSILRLLGAGLSNKQIAQHSNLSVHTVKNYVHRILKRLAVQNRIQAADYFQTLAVRAGARHETPGARS